MSECLISYFLARGLLQARSGIERSDMIVKYLARNVIKTAALATLWSIAALVSWFWLKKHILIYRIFDITSGAVYTHAIFDTLIFRTRLRDRMAATSSGSAYVDLGYPSHQSEGRFPIVSNLSHTPHTHFDSEPGKTLADKNGIIEIELGKMSSGKPGIPYEF